MIKQIVFDQEKFDQLRSDVANCNKCDDFRIRAEEAFGFTHLPSALKGAIHWQAWERGHSSGYCEVLNEYHDIVDLVNQVIKCCGES